MAFPEDPLGGGRTGWRELAADLAPRGIPPAEILRLREPLLEHWRRLCTDLDRDPGLRVALVDYLLNRSGHLRDPVFMETEWFDRWSASGRDGTASGILSEARFGAALQRELNRAIRYGHDLSLLKLDWERETGAATSGGVGQVERVPEPLRDLLRRSMRISDLIGRSGTGGIFLLLPGTDRMGAHDLGERILRTCACPPAGSRPSGQPPVPVIRGGVAAFPEDGTSPGKLIDRAEAACSRAGRRDGGGVTVYYRERRRKVRRPLSGVVFRVRTGEASETAEAIAETRDFSRRGVFLETTIPCGIGQEVWLLPPGAPASGRTAAVRARVVRRRETPQGSYPFGLAVEIADPEDRRRIAGWVGQGREPAAGKEPG